MEGLIAGAIAGYVMAMLTSAVVAYLVFRGRDAVLIRSWVAKDVPGPILLIPIFTGSVLTWVFIGLISGLIYELAGLAAQPDGLGSPSITFTIIAILFALLPALFLGILSAKLWWIWTSLALSCAALFGWLLPHLAGR